MNQPIRLVLVLHNHQPIGNFDHVFEAAYQDSYLPFLDVFEPFENIRIALHTSGPLMEWLDAEHPEYLSRLAELVRHGRVEIVGGAFHEPILTMIPSRDRIGQITTYTEWLESRFECQVRGMWMPERVWEQSLTRDVAEAGISYTLLDDFHFKNAGLFEDQLHGYYVTEDDGHVIRVLPGSERLRYLIPFQDPQQTIDYLGEIHGRQPNAVVVFGDDGEKFGTWPETKKHVYEDGWLRWFFELLSSNRDWIQTATPTTVLQDVKPLGNIYLPEGSYREMTEWSLPTGRQIEYGHLQHDLQQMGQWERTSSFVQGGFWRNFKVKYPESNEMYARMMLVSQRLQEASQKYGRDGAADDLIEQARSELYRGQCNCSYWHGAFGGIYLPHLRNAVYHHLIAAENLLHAATGLGGESWADFSLADFNFDGQEEVLLSNDRLAAFFEPDAGGRMYELDVRSICHNVLATLARRPEAYHEKVVAGANPSDADVASIHDRVVFKQEGLDKLVQHDRRLRKSFQDHFLANDASLEDLAAGRAAEWGDFADGHFHHHARNTDDGIEVELRREGRACDLAMTLTKRVRLQAGSSVLAVDYLLEGVPQDRPIHFAVELNFAGLPAGADDRYFYDAEHNALGDLGSHLDLTEIQGLGLIDEWLGVDVGLSFNRATRIWAYPIASVSQSEGGFEAVHQSVVVMPHWLVQGDASGRWGVSFNLAIDTTLAEKRHAAPDHLVAAS